MEKLGRKPIATPAHGKPNVPSQAQDIAMDARLERLLTKSHCGLGTARLRELWFGDCVMRGSVVFIPTEDRAESARRCFMSFWRHVVSDCEVKVGTVETKSATQVYRGRG